MNMEEYTYKLGAKILAFSAAIFICLSILAIGLKYFFLSLTTPESIMLILTVISAFCGVSNIALWIEKEVLKLTEKLSSTDQ